MDSALAALMKERGTGSTTVTATVVVKLGARKHVAATTTVVVVLAMYEHGEMSVWSIMISYLLSGLSHRGTCNQEFQMSP